MNFDEALNAMKDGRKVRAVNWADYDYTYVEGVIAYNCDGEQLSFDFIDTQSEWELYGTIVQPKWIKFSEEKLKALKAKHTIESLELIQKHLPLELQIEMECVWTYIHQQIFIEEEMDKFTQGFGYKPDISYKNYTAKYIEDTAISD